MIGDGMGPGQLEAASLYRHGRAGALVMQTLEHRGQLATASLSGITDSAAAATAMATGVKTLNGNIGVDAGEAPVETIVEWASARGLATGLVTTAAMPHATPGAFSAHRGSRQELTAIADDQVRSVRPTVMLGGGARYFLPAGPGSERTDAGLLGDIEAAGYELVTSAGDLAAREPDADLRVWGMFADEHMAYERQRAGEPSLTEMSLRALDILDRDDDGFFVMIEGARIDMASHLNDIENSVGDTLAFDDAVAAVRDWIGDRDDVLLIVTADHECGGLHVEEAAGAGEMPVVSWRWDQHTNARVDVFAQGPGAEQFDGAVLDHPWVHAAMVAQLERAAVAAPATVITPDGRVSDLRHAVADQLADTGFGAGYNELRSIRVDADAHGLAVAGTGVFQWQENAVVVLIDVDHGAGTGVRDVAAALTDTGGRIDAILSSVPVIGPATFGAELAAASWGAQDARREDLWGDAGLRGLVAPYGAPNNFGWHGIAFTFGEGVRSVDGAVPGTDGEGFELFVPWQTLYPALGGAVPPSAEVAIAAVIVNDDGGYLSNQALPPFPAGTANPGRQATALPGVIAFVVDSDGDGVGDGASAPRVIAAD